MMGAAAPTQTNPSFKQCIVSPCEDATSGGIVKDDVPTPSTTLPSNATPTNSFEAIEQFDPLPNPDKISNEFKEGETKTPYALIVGAVILAFIFLKKKK